MSCNGCRVLRKGCSEGCVLRTCLQWIETPEAQGNATLFLAKFFGRSDLLSFISAVPQNQRPALFQSLLFEACGRTVNPVNGAVGLLSSGNWHVCQAAVETVLAGGTVRPMQGILAPPSRLGGEDTWRGSAAASNRRSNSSSVTFDGFDLSAAAAQRSNGGERLRRELHHQVSEESVMSSGYGIGDRKERKLLNLFF